MLGYDLINLSKSKLKLFNCETTIRKHLPDSAKTRQEMFEGHGQLLGMFSEKPCLLKPTD